ncbi:amidase [Oleiharenicola lentus]|uniref:amidase n=1 Tax=Oleiharenicola lentus TaxID=2508720 RepID=UPI003F67F323
MDTNALKTPATLPFAAWQSLSPAEVARETQIRIAALPDDLHRAAIAWLRLEGELVTELEAGKDSTAPLRGIPYVLKDLFDLYGVPTFAGSTFLKQARGTPVADSAIVLRLRELGAACVAKTHLVEFAAGLFGDNLHYGDCPHPHFPERLSGGSSSGSAALVGVGAVPFAIGTDTGGSMRVPAAFCGVYGFRNAPRDAFIRDAVALSPTFDTVGWFTNNGADLLTATSALLGEFEPAHGSLRGVYVPAKSFGITFDPETAEAYENAAKAFAPSIDSVASEALFSSWQNAIDAYTVIALSEAHVVHREWLTRFKEHYTPSIWQRFTDGGHYTPAQIEGARATIATVRAAFAAFFVNHDYLILPATPFPALRKDECTPEARKSLLTLTAPASLGGLPVVTIPVILSSGLTTGLQIIVPSATSAAIPGLLKT